MASNDPYTFATNFSAVYFFVRWIGTVIIHSCNYMVTSIRSIKPAMHGELEAAIRGTLLGMISVKLVARSIIINNYNIQYLKTSSLSSRVCSEPHR